MGNGHFIEWGLRSLRSALEHPPHAIGHADRAIQADLALRKIVSRAESGQMPVCPMLRQKFDLVFDPDDPAPV